MDENKTINEIVVEDKRGLEIEEAPEAVAGSQETKEETAVSEHSPQDIVPDDMLPPGMPQGLTFEQLEQINKTREELFASDDPIHVASTIMVVIQPDVVLSQLQANVITRKLIDVIWTFGNKFKWSASYEAPPNLNR